jgi:type II restriction enzyme
MSDGGHSAPLRDEIVAGLEGLPDSRLRMIASLVNALKTPAQFTAGVGSDVVDERFAEVMTNLLVLHHALHEELLSKKRFEHVFKQCLIAQGHDAQLNATPGALTYDVTGGGRRWSLKTEAAKGISATQVKIEKLMEARWIRECATAEACAAEVRKRLAHHMDGYDRILVLRAFVRPATFEYRLEEIPTEVLRRCFAEATPQIFVKKRDSPSFGADFFMEGHRTRAFRMLLDSSVEKVRIWFQVDHCIRHGAWVVPRIDSGVVRRLHESELSPDRLPPEQIVRPQMGPGQDGLF